MIKLRRLRQNSIIRDLVAETRLAASDLIMPYFVVDGKDKREPIESMPGVYRLSVDNLVKDIKECRELGIKAVLLFGVSKKRDSGGSEAYSEKGIVQRAVREIKGKIRKDKDKEGEIRKDKGGTKDIVVITDVCLCGYTSHGHCGIAQTGVPSPPQGERGRVRGNKHNNPPHLNLLPPKGGEEIVNEFIIDNDETLKVLAKIALSHAEAGADLVAPSAMMDGQVGAIRKALDEKGYQDTGILGYSAKYASNFYGPFREALDSAPQFGDRKGYQMDYRNSNEALREVRQDIEEGADIVMVKPALAYLDIIRRVKDNFNVPVAAYNVSGEYAMVKAYCRSAVIARSPEGATKQSQKRDCFGTSCLAMTHEIVLEVLTAIKRAGADLVITYHAKEAARWLH